MRSYLTIAINLSFNLVSARNLVQQFQNALESLQKSHTDIIFSTKLNLQTKLQLGLEEESFASETEDGSISRSGNKKRFKTTNKNNENLNPYKRYSLGPAANWFDGDYGCWCYVGVNHYNHYAGQGAPVDIWDQACKNLHNGYECIMIDQNEENPLEMCIPWEVNYAPIQIFCSCIYESAVPDCSCGAGAFSSIEEECILLNPTSVCAQRACMVEANLLVIILENIGNNIDCDSNYKHENGFNVTETCHKPSGSGSGNPGIGEGGSSTCPPITTTISPLTIPPQETKKCCGSYGSGTRFPFVTCDYPEEIESELSGKQCCGEHVYNADLFTCCEGAVTLGSC